MKPVKLTNEQIHIFCAALADLLSAGIGTADALVLLKEDEESTVLRQMLEEMARKADAGEPLARVMGDSRMFPAYVCTLVTVGQQVGRLDQTLKGLGEYYEEQARMDREVRAALLYPAVLLAVLLAVAVILLVWVLPVFNDVYAQLGSSLTGVAGGLLAFGGLLRQSLPGICILVAVFAGVLAVAPLRRSLQKLWRKLRGDRGTARQLFSARYVQAFSMALTSGMTDSEAATLAGKLAEGETPAFGVRCDRCQKGLDEGKPLPGVLRENGFLSPSDCRLLEAGIHSGKGELALQQIARRLLDRSREALQQQAGRLEPSLVAVSCGLIGAVVLSVMLPLMHIMSAIG